MNLPINKKPKKPVVIGTGHRLFLILFPLLYALFNEIVFSIFLKQGFTIHKLTFALLEGFFLYWLGQLNRRRVRGFILQTIFAVIYSLVYGIQLTYYTLFETPFYLKSLGGAGAAMTGFFGVVISSILAVGPALLLIILCFLLWISFYRKYFLLVPYSENRGWKSLLCMTAWMVLALSMAVIDYNGATSPSYMFLYEFVPTESVKTFGMLPTAVLDIKYNIFHLQTTRTETVHLNLDSIEVQTASQSSDDSEQVLSSEDSASTGSGFSDSDAAEEGSVNNSTGLVALENSGHENTKVNTRVYDSEEYNALDIDFSKETGKDEDEINAEYADMNAYFSSQTPSKKNEYTGMFEGKNLILITAEAFSKFIIDPELTPTLYKLQTEGFQFNHFYTPIWGVSTSDGEFVATTGLIPEAGVWSYTEIADNYMPFAFGNQFRSLGYLTQAFHNHSYVYYNRDKSYPNMGYDFYAKGEGMKITDTWPESDVEMIDESVMRYTFDTDQPFHVYYMSVSGHLEYSYETNAMSAKHWDQVKDLPYSDTVKAYIASQLELEDALTELLDLLDQKGVLEDTVIALSPDHYPYGLTTEQYRELRGEDFDETFGLYESTFILWTPSMEEPISVDTYCSSLDIAPTLSNLFGLDYDSRLYIGTDIFGDVSPTVCFQDRSFITDKIMYDNTNQKIIQLTDDELSADYLGDCIDKVKDKFYYSAKIIDTDYYGYLYDKLPALPGETEASTE